MTVLSDPAVRIAMALNDLNVALDDLRRQRDEFRARSFAAELERDNMRVKTIKGMSP